MIYDENKGFCSEKLLFPCQHSLIINRQIKLWLHCLSFSLHVVCNFNCRGQKSHRVQSTCVFRVSDFHNMCWVLQFVLSNLNDHYEVKNIITLMSEACAMRADEINLIYILGLSTSWQSVMITF
jgi:hypothetical protein